MFDRRSRRFHGLVHRSPRARGSALIILLAALTAVTLLIAAQYTHLASARLADARQARDSLREEALAYGLAQLESSLRRQLVQATPLRPVAIDDDGAVLFAEFDVEYPPPAWRSDGAAPSLVHCVARPDPDGEWCDVVERDPEDGRPSLTTVRLLRLADASERQFEWALFGHLVSAFPDDSTNELTDLARALAGDLHALRLGVDAPRTPDELAARLAEILDARAATPLSSGDTLADGREELLVGLDPLPRFRRFNAEEERASGRDRASFAAAGACLAPQTSGCYLLEAILHSERDSRVARRARRRVALLERARTADQARAAAAPCGGSERVLAAHPRAWVGPEVAADITVRSGAALFVGAPAGVNPSELAWRATGPGALGVGDASALLLAREADDWILRTVEVPAEVRRATPLAARRGAPCTLLAAGSVLCRAEHLCATDSRTTSHSLAAVAVLHRLGDALLGVGDGGRLQLLDEWGAELAAATFEELAARPAQAALELPALAAVAWPPADADDSWMLIDSTLGSDSIALACEPILGPISDGARGAWWIERDAADPERVLPVHAEFGVVGAGLAPRLARGASIELEATAIATLPVHDLLLIAGAGSTSAVRVHAWRRDAVRLAYAGGGALPASSRTMFASASGDQLFLAVADGLWAVLLFSTTPKQLALGLSAGLRPRPDERAAAFAAPLASGFEARLASGAVVESSGSANRTGSVLRAADLSDLFADGVYFSPLRNETLRYSSDSLEVPESPFDLQSGSGSLLVKPERPPETSPEPERERVLLRVTQRFEARLAPTAEWIEAAHPEHPAVADLRAISVAGPAVRAGTVTSWIGRRPEQAEWFHRRAHALEDGPWTITVTVGEPPRVLDPWTVDAIWSAVTSSAEATTADTGSGGAWQRLEWGWRDGGDALLSGAAGGDWAPAPERSPFAGGAGLADSLMVVATGWEVELGGEIGGKAFRGTLADLRIDGAAAEPERAARPIFDAAAAAGEPHLTWRLPQACAAGARLLRVHAAGTFPVGTSIEWQLRQLGGTFVASAGGGGPLPNLGFGTTPAVARVEAAIRLAPDVAGLRAPLVEALEVEWLAPPPARWRAVEARVEWDVDPAAGAP